MECVDIADWPDKSLMGLPIPDGRRGDIGIFLNKTDNDTDCKFWYDPEFEAGSSCLKSRWPYAGRNSHAHVTVLGEVKLTDPPFGYSPTDDFLHLTDGGAKTRGQMCDYAGEAMFRQHRLFFFMFVVYRTYGRFIRFDSVGAVVTESIDLKTEPDQFFELFWRVAQLKDVKLGIDPTAKLVRTLDNYERYEADLQAALAQFPSSRTQSSIMKAFEGDLWPLYRLEVPDKEDATKTHQFLVRNPSTDIVSLTGRATKGFIAFHVKEKKFCFLKDSWRPDSSRIHSELDVYKKLESRHITGIATVHCGGDLRCRNADGSLIPQTTVTQSLPGATEYLRRIHTRIVLNEVGIPLAQYIHSRELCRTIAVAFFGECLDL